jgi:hypothetical protein
VGLERGSLNLVNTIEELLERKSSGSGKDNRYYGRRDTLRCPRDSLYLEKLALTSPTSCGRSVCVVRWRTKTTEFGLIFYAGHYPSACLLFKTQLTSQETHWVSATNPTG